MGLDDLLISTGVDGLIKLVQEKGKVEINEASRILNVPVQSIEEWSHMLETEGLIKIQYQLTHVFLVWSPLATSEQNQRRQGVGEKKEKVVAQMQTLAKSVEESKVELSALQEQLSNVQMRTQGKMQKLSIDLAQSQHLDQQVTQSLMAKQTAIAQMRQEIEGLTGQLESFSQNVKNQPGPAGRPNIKGEVEKLTAAEGQLKEKLDKATKLFDTVQGEIDVVKGRLASDHSLEDLGRLQQVVEDLQFARAEMEKTTSTILNETKMMEDEIASLGKRLKEIESKKGDKFNPKKLRDQVDVLSKSVEKERAGMLEDLDKSLQAVRKQVELYSQTQYQYQNISTRIESLRSALTQSNAELENMEQSISTANKTYAKDIAEAHADLESEKAEYDQMAAKAKQVEMILGHLQEIKGEGEALSLKLKGIIKEAQVYGLTSSMVAETGGRSGAAERGVSNRMAPVLPAATEGGTISPELARRIELTTQEEEDFERKRQEMSLLVRKMWEEDRKPKDR